MAAGIKAAPYNKATMRRLHESEMRINEGIRNAFLKIGRQVKTTTEELILKKPKSGKLYRIKRGGRVFWHRASAPEEAPSELTGGLRKSIAYTVAGSNTLEIGYLREGVAKDGAVGVVYGRAMELGNPSRKVAPRPAIIKAAEIHHKYAEEMLETEVKISLVK